MGISYTPRKVTGIRLDYIQMDELVKFLATHGYELSEDELEEIEENGWEEFPTMKGVEWEIFCMDGWSGHGWAIGFEGKKRSHLKIMQDAFPNAKVEVFDYVELG